MHRRLASRTANAEPDVVSPVAPAIVVPPPSNPIAIELPADDIPIDHRPHSFSFSSSIPPRVSDEKIAIMGPDELAPQDANAIRTSGEYRPSPVSSGSPRRSGELETNAPPPLPPKTPIPYPDDGGSTAGI